MTDTSGETTWTYDPLNQVREQAALIQGETYTTGFDYDQAGNRTGIFYPEATDWLRYTYTVRHEVQSITGLIDEIRYDAAGNRTSMTRSNGVTGTYTADNRHRPDVWREVGPSGGGDILRFAYGYDGEGNVTSRNSNVYQYDALNRLTLANVAGVFEQEIAARVGAIDQDYFASKPVDFTRSPSQRFSLDTNAASVALDFGTSIAAVTRFTLAPRQGPAALQGRLVPESLVVATSGDNSSYAVVDPNAVGVHQDEWDRWHFELDEPLAAAYVKVHSRFDDRDETGEPVDVSTFENALGEMLTAWQQTKRARLEYAYDSRGNRIQETVTKASAESWTYVYDKTEQLITDGRYAYAFDANGNMTAKSNRYTLRQVGGEYVVDFHEISPYDPFAAAWEYTWDLFNRLSEVRKNGQVVGRYTYNGDNLRVAVEEDGLTRHVVFDPDGIRVVGEYVVARGGSGSSGVGASGIETPDIRQIVYLNAFHQAAEIHGLWGDGAATVYHLHVDMLGSVHAMTDVTGTLVWTQDYLPFGDPLNERVMGAQPRYTFTGKPWDGAAGQYYFNARYYQATIGRFTAVDPARDGLHWYAYVYNNPFKYFDPDGQRALQLGYEVPHDAWERLDLVAVALGKWGTAEQDFTVRLIETSRVSTEFVTGSGWWDYTNKSLSADILKAHELYQKGVRVTDDDPEVNLWLEFFESPANKRWWQAHNESLYYAADTDRGSELFSKESVAEQKQIERVLTAIKYLTVVPPTWHVPQFVQKYLLPIPIDEEKEQLGTSAGEISHEPKSNTIHNLDHQHASASGVHYYAY